MVLPLKKHIDITSGTCPRLCDHDLVQNDSKNCHLEKEIRKVVEP